MHTSPMPVGARLRLALFAVLIAGLGVLGVGLARPSAHLPLAKPAGGLEERAFDTNVTTTFAIPLTADRTNLAGIAEQAAGGKVHWLGSPYGGAKSRGVMLSFFGVGADGAQGTCKVWLVYQGGAGSNPDTDTMRRAYYGSAVFTLSSSVTGLAGSDLADASQYFADTLTWTLSSTGTSPKGPGVAIEAAFGSPGSAAYSPADDADQAVLFLPDLGNADGILLEMDKGTATSVNAVITRIDN